MNQRKEFVLKAIHTRNFRQLCEEYGISSVPGKRSVGASEIVLSCVISTEKH